MTFTTGLLLLLTLPALLASIYLLVLSLLSAPLRTPPPAGRSLKLAVVIPAHDEEVCIARTVRSLLATDWPAAQRRVLVIADNCSDGTQAAAEAAGATVWPRSSQTRRGKGYALEFAYQRVLEEGWADAVVVVDADTEVTPNLLSAMAARIGAGAESAQAYYGVLNPGASWRTRLMSLALALFHRLRSRGRERLGASCGLRGNGMCFSTALLRRIPHRAFTVAEDLEYGITLGLAGVRIAYVDEAEVRGEMVSGGRASVSQRQRWEGGRWLMAKTRAPALLAAGLRQRSMVPLDLAFDLLTPPLAYLGFWALVATAAALGAVGLQAAPAWVLLPGALSLAMIAVYVLRGLVISGLGWRGVMDLMRAPFYLLWKLSLLVRRNDNKRNWVRTDREKTP